MVLNYVLVERHWSRVCKTDYRSVYNYRITQPVYRINQVRCGRVHNEFVIQFISGVILEVTLFLRYYDYKSITNKIYHVWFFSCFLWFWYFVYDQKEKSFWFLLCHFDFKFVAFDFSNVFLISKIWRVWFLKFDAFDFSNDTFDFQNLSRLISQMTLLISKICRVWFLKWRFWLKTCKRWQAAHLHRRETFETFHILLHWGDLFQGILQFKIWTMISLLYSGPRYGSVQFMYSNGKLCKWSRTF